MSICDQMDAHSHTSLSRVKTFLLKATRACIRESNVIFVLYFFSRGIISLLRFIEHSAWNNNWTYCKLLAMLFNEKRKNINAYPSL